MKEILQVLKNLRLPKRGKKRLLLCPKCKSPRIKKVGKFSGWLIPEEYYCPNCGYKGPIVLEVEEGAC